MHPPSRLTVQTDDRRPDPVPSCRVTQDPHGHGLLWFSPDERPMRFRTADAAFAYLRSTEAEVQRRLAGLSERAAQAKQRDA